MSGTAFQRVSAAVDAVADVVAEDEAYTWPAIYAAVSTARRRRIDLTFGPLPAALSGERRSFPDHDEVIVAETLPDPDRTLAHELGHIVLGHEGVAPEDALSAVDPELVRYMLNERRTAAAPNATVAQQEWEAEAFAALFLERVAILRGRGNPVTILRHDEAIGR